MTASPSPRWPRRTAGRFRANAASDVPIHSRLVVNAAEAAVDAAVAGLGVTRVLSYQAADAIAASTLQVLLAGFEPPPMPVSLIHREARFPPAKVRSFTTFAARLRQKLGAGTIA